MAISDAFSGALITRFAAPSGRPASFMISIIRLWVLGHSSDAFRITVLAQAKAAVGSTDPTFYAEAQRLLVVGFLDGKDPGEMLAALKTTAGASSR